MKKYITILLLLFCSLILAASVRGVLGNPTAQELNSPMWKEDGPFELSPERGRFSLLYSLAEDNSFIFSDDIGRFASPDVAVHEGKYVSLFAPLLSFIALPGYIVGKYFGISQVGAFAVIAGIAVLNALLIRFIALRLGANSIASSVGALVFLFATPAYAYAVNLYQHHVSTFLILLSIYALLRSEKVWSLLLVFFLCALSIPLDYPNAFFLFPIGVYALGRIISFEKVRQSIKVRLRLLRSLTPLIMIIPIVFFLWFNASSYGNPFQLSGTLQTSKEVTSDITVTEATKSLQAIQGEKTVIEFFKPRALINGLYIHFISPDRGMVHYAPIMFLGVIGVFLAFRRGVPLLQLMLGIILANILLYAMWGDPWGGWAFGSRYLIPTYALLSLFLALLLTYWGRNSLFLMIFIPVLYYSVSVNTLGAITTSANPPQVEVLKLEELSGKVQKYTYERNWDYLVTGHTKSFAYHTFFRSYMTVIQFYQLLCITIFVFISAHIIYQVAFPQKGKEHNA